MVTLEKKQQGVLNALLLPFIITLVLLIGAIGFGISAYSGKQDYKNNVDSKIADAVSVATKNEDTKNAQAYAEEAKNPLKTYNGPAAYGSLQVQYPKTWSGYVIEQNTDSHTVDGYFNPNVVPYVSADSSSFALRVRVLSQSYASVMQTFQGNITTKLLTATPYSFPKVSSVIGTKLDGQVINSKQGTMIVMPLRENTLEVWTEGTAGAADFAKYILPEFSFSP